MALHVGFSLLTLFPGRVGGSESNVRGLLDEFSAGNGPEALTVLANRHVMPAYREYERGPVRVHEVRSYRAGDSDATRALAMLGARLFPRRAARDVPAGLDVVHYPVTVPIPELPLPKVVTLHDVQHLDLPGLLSRPERAYRSWAYEGAARRATLVITSSAYSRGRLVEVAGLDPERIEVIPVAVNHERFRPGPGERDDELLAALELPERFVAYPANMWPHKNHARLIEALARVDDRELVLVFTGQDYGKLDALNARAAELGVADRVRHLGFLAPDAVPALYRRALALVYPSLYEGFGIPPLEAMACGCPVAASTRASLAELVGGAAVELDPEDPDSIAAAIESVTGDEGVRERLRKAGIERAARYTWPSAAAAHRAVYERARETLQTPPG